MVQRDSVLDFFGVVRVVGYSLALVAALVVIALYLASLQLRLALGLAAPFTALVMLGLLVAWTAGLSRVFVRRIRFTSPQDRSA